jgi:hypothetical protein
MSNSAKDAKTAKAQERLKNGAVIQWVKEETAPSHSEQSFGYTETSSFNEQYLKELKLSGADPKKVLD